MPRGVVTTPPQLLDKIEKKFQRLPPVLGVKLSNETNGNALRPNRKWEIQHGGRQNGSTYISACRPLRNAVSTAKPMFSGSPNSMGCSSMPRDHTGSGNSNMAAAKPEVLISQLADQCCLRVVHGLNEELILTAIRYICTRPI